MFMDAKKVVQAINGEFDWAINSIIIDVKKLFLKFTYVKFFFHTKNS